MKLSEILNDVEELGLYEAARASIGLRSRSIQNIIDEEIGYFRTKTAITNRNTIPDTNHIPIENPVHWMRIPDVIACFVDMEGSTKLSASLHPSGTAKTYRLFTGTAVRIFHHFEASYIDIKGDGVFATFDADKAYTALAATVSFKTFVQNEFSSKIKETTELDIGGHFGIDRKDVLVRKLGLKFHAGRTDRQNEVWAGKPVNMAAKLAGLSTGGKLWVSDRFYRTITDNKARISCGCPDGTPVPLWEKEDVSDDTRFDFDTAYTLASDWCSTHGKRFCSDLVKLDEA